MRFSVCIPNYNYGRYLGQTIKSVVEQEGVDLELVISDNASTDNSVEVIKGFSDSRIKLQVNRCNVGFAGNLDQVGSMASGDHMIMLSSDDLMAPGALRRYQAILKELGPRSGESVLTATWDVIDPQGQKTGTQGPDKELWPEKDRVPQLESSVDHPVYGVGGTELLGRCLKKLRNPFNFAATCYPLSLYQRVGGYGGNRLVNPDKWFHWKILRVAEKAYFVDAPLFCYRWHPTNQTALELNAGSLKFLVDEYVSTLELDASVLQNLGLTRDQIIKAFLENDIVNHGLATLARGSRSRAKRILRFGEAVYPDQLRSVGRRWLLRSLLLLGPLGQFIARVGYARHNRLNSPCHEGAM